MLAVLSTLSTLSTGLRDAFCMHVVWVECCVRVLNKRRNDKQTLCSGGFHFLIIISRTKWQYIPCACSVSHDQLDCDGSSSQFSIDMSV